MNFIAFDFETANSKKSSICSLGYCIVENNQIIEKQHILINPKEEFNFINISIHHITPEMVENAPEFPEVWFEIEPLFKKYPLVAHAAKSADVPMLKAAFKKYNMANPELNFYDTAVIAKNNLDLNNNKLETVSKYFDIDLCNHHDALCDATATALIMIEFCKHDFIMQSFDIEARGFSKTRNIPVFGLIPPDSFVTFSDDTNRMEFLKEIDIYPKTATIPKPLFYKGTYSKDYCRCNVVGYITNSTLVIEMDSHLHCINTDCFIEMQPNVSDIPDYINNYPFYVEHIDGSEKEKEVIKIIKKLLNPEVLNFASLKFQVNKQKYNSIIIEIEPNAYRMGSDKSTLFARINDSESDGYIAFSERHKKIFNDVEFEYYVQESDKFHYISLNQFIKLAHEQPETLKIFLNRIFLASFDFPTFSCCSRFKECSKAKHCIHPDILYATACEYKKNLDQGKIFY